MTEREALLHVVRGAVAALERSRDRIDDLNVYPVPDGDTGTNLALTARAVLEALEDSAAEDRPTIARETTRAALMGARGNSGVILSQIVRGIAESLEAEGPLDGGVVARALRGGSDAAYRAVRNPVEGTMLTAIRALAEAAEAEQSRPVAELLELLVTRGEVAVARTQEQLDVLREALVNLRVGVSSADVKNAIDRFATGETSGPVAALQPRIDAWFGYDGIEDIVAALQRDGSELAQATLKTLNEKSPRGMVVALKLLRLARASASLEECLVREYRAALEVFRSDDFREGIRAAVIDKDRNPRWSPPRIEDVTPEMVAPYFAEIGADELIFDRAK